MTNLLDFPPEVFQEVVHQLVTCAGVREAWNLRKVCRTFDAAIQYDVFAKQTQNIISRDYNGCKSVLWRKSWLYVFHRTKMPLDAREDLPNKVLGMSNWLSDNATNLTMDANELTETVCKAVVAGMSLYEFRSVTGLNSGYSRETTIKDLSKGLQVSDKLAMAAILDDRSLVEELLPQTQPGMRLWRPHWEFDSIFGDMIVNACRFGRVSVIDCIRDYLAQRKNQQNAAYNLLVNYYFRHHIHPILSKAMFEAMTNGHTDIFKTLLDMHKAHGTKLKKETYNAWLAQAVKSGSVEYVRMIMQIKGISRPRVLLSTFKRACSLRYTDVVSALLADGGMGANDTFSNWTPLVAAIRLGNDQLVGAVLDAGAAVNGVCYCFEEHIIPLQIAVGRRGAAIIKTLIDRGASVKHIKVSGSQDQAIRELINNAKAQAEKHVSGKAQEKDS